MDETLARDKKFNQMTVAIYKKYWLKNINERRKTNAFIMWSLYADKFNENLPMFPMLTQSV
jgi:hypothetical protein